MLAHDSPQLCVEQLTGCRHYFPLESPERLNAVLTRFVRGNAR